MSVVRVEGEVAKSVHSTVAMRLGFVVFKRR